MTESTPSDERRSARWSDLLLVALVGAALYLPALGNHDLWDPDEPRYAEVAREMTVSGNFLVPHLNGVVYTHKPPLLFWSIAAVGALRGGVDEIAARLPSAGAGIGALVLLFAIAQRFVSRRASWFAVAALATGNKVIWQARTGQIDMLLAALVALAVYFWVRGYSEGRPGFYRLFFVAAGLATLAKGPVGLLPPLLAIVAFLLFRKEYAELRRLRIPTGLLIWAAVVGAWLVPAALAAGADYWNELVFTQNVTRYAAPSSYSGTQGHMRPWYHYLKMVPADFFPWSLLVPTALVFGWRERRTRARTAWLFAAFWVGVTVLFFSLSPAKRSLYVLQMYPGLALLVGLGLDRLAAGRTWNRSWLVAPALLLAGVGVAGAVVGHQRAPELLRENGLPDALRGWLVVVLATLALVGAIAAALAWQRRVVAYAGVLAAGFGLASLVAIGSILPALDGVKSERAIAARFLELASPDARLAFVPRAEPGFLFYTERFGKVLEDEGEIEEFLAAPGDVWLFARRDRVAAEPRLAALETVMLYGDERTGYALLRRPVQQGMAPRAVHGHESRAPVGNFFDHSLETSRLSDQRRWPGLFQAAPLASEEPAC